MKFKIYTLGCKVNAYESEMMKEKLLNNGYVMNETDPDIIIINTCSVTNVADQKSRKMVRHFKNEHPNAIVVVCGCSTEHKKDEYEKMGIDILLGNSKKSNIVELIEDFKKRKEPIMFFEGARKIAFEDMAIDEFTTHTRAFVKIQDGCDNFCSYCVIPFVRGSIRSKDFNLVLKEVETLVKHGHKEIVLTGIHTGSYGYGTEHDLTDVIHEISKIDGLERIRISSIEITELDDKFLNELKNNMKICNHLHIPLQAGSDEILKLMNRKYDLKKFYGIIERIRSIRPDISITTDVIVGFPFETDELFMKTVKTVKELSFSKIHVFPYSKKAGTKASLMQNQVNEVIKKERVKVLTEVSNELEIKYASSFIGKSEDVLIETCEDGVSTGCTSNYLKVIINKKLDRNSIVRCKLDRLKGKEIVGEIV